MKFKFVLGSVWINCLFSWFPFWWIATAVEFVAACSCSLMMLHCTCSSSTVYCAHFWWKMERAFFELFNCAGTEMVEPERIWGDNKCGKSDIVINQGPTAPLPSGIPTYTVEIMNMCVSGCDISSIHLSCGWFSSARLINPKVFKRLRFNDCLVNDGRPLINGGTISFQYANTFLYPLSVSSVACESDWLIWVDPSIWNQQLVSSGLLTWH